MKSNDYEVVEAPERNAGDPVARPPKDPSNRPAWLFRIIFICITLAALLLTPVVIQNMGGSREEISEVVEAIPERTSPPIIPSIEPEAGDETGSVDIDEPLQPRPEADKAESIEAISSEKAASPSTAPQYDVAVIQSIVDEQRRLTSSKSEVYWAIATAQYNMARMLYQIAGIDGDKLEESTRAPKPPNKKEDGPYYLWETTYNGNVVIDVCKVLLGRSNLPETQKSERLKSYPSEFVDQYMPTLKSVPRALIDSIPFIYPQISHEQKLSSQMAAHLSESRTGHTLEQSEQAYRDVVGLLNEILAERGRPEDYRRVAEIKQRHENKMKVSDDTLHKLAANMESAVMLLGILVSP
jgi:hypothetical protein